MKILLIDTYYDKFLKSFYNKNINLEKKEYYYQKNSLLNSCFGTSDSYSYFLRKNNWEAEDLIVNCFPLQKKWSQENNFKLSKIRPKIPHRLFKLPLIRNVLINSHGIIDVAKKQIKKYQPDIIYCQDISFFPKEILIEIKKENNIKLIVGQIACPLPPNSFIEPYDLILTSFPHFVDKLRKNGKKCDYFRIGFDKRILSKVPIFEKDINFSFIGGISKYHKHALKNIEYLVSNADLKVYGYGANKLPINSIIRNKHNGEKWGLDMYKTLGKTKISFNRHINVAENNANNMRLFEATGMGSLLITDKKDNLNQLFEVDREIVTYKSKEEALEKYNYLMDNPFKIKEIAYAGQQRTLRDHTYEIRMHELIEILKKYL